MNYEKKTANKTTTHTATTKDGRKSVITGKPYAQMDGEMGFRASVGKIGRLGLIFSHAYGVFGNLEAAKAHNHGLLGVS